MTMHVPYSHQCGVCESHYLPYDADVPCPKCGLVEGERFDYIPQAVASMRINKQSGGSYTPGAWFVGSLGDHILHLLFGIFDAYEARQEQIGFEQFIDEILSRITWDDQEYLREHLRGIAIRVHEELTLPG